MQNRSIILFCLIILTAPAVSLADVDTLRTTGLGSTDEWTASAGNKYECVDEDSPNDNTDYIYVAAALQTQDLTVSDIGSITSVDSVWIKAQWTWTKATGGDYGCDLYYYNGTDWSANFNVAVTKNGVYVRDSVKWTSPSVAAVNAMQVRCISETAVGGEETRLTWWGIVVYGTVGAAETATIMGTVIE